jgi:hypothetical protein
VLQVWASSVTDTRGEYRFLALPVGAYYLRVMPRNSESVHELMTNPAMLDASGSDRAKSEPEGYPVVYHPGTGVAGAKVVQIADGTTADLPAIRVARVRTGRVRGTVVHHETGRPVAARVLLIPRDGAMDSNWTRLFQSNDGQFDLRGVLPGAYVLTAEGSGATGLTGLTAVEVREGEAPPVEVKAYPRSEIAGRVTVEAWPGPDPPDFSQLVVRLEPAVPSAVDGTFPGLPLQTPAILAAPNSGGAFTLRGVPLGHYRVTLSAAGARGGTYAKSIRMGSRDALGSPLQLDRPASASESIDIVLGIASGGLDGRVSDRNRADAALARVVLVPADRDRRDLYATAVTTNTGRFQLRNLAPGDYTLFAWQYAPDGAWTDPDFLEPHEKLGTPVRIEEGSAEFVELALTP